MEARLAVHDSRRGTHARLRFPFGSVRHRDLLHRGPQTSLALRQVHNSRIRSLVRIRRTGTRKSTQSLHIRSALTATWLTLAEVSLTLLFYLKIKSVRFEINRIHVSSIVVLFLLCSSRTFLSFLYIWTIILQAKCTYPLQITAYYSTNHFTLVIWQPNWKLFITNKIITLFFKIAYYLATLLIVCVTVTNWQLFITKCL